MVVLLGSMVSLLVQRPALVDAAVWTEGPLGSLDLDAPRASSALNGHADTPTLGVKSWIVKKTVHLLADAIRHGGRAAHHVIRFLDDKAARAFRKHSKRIADGLDDIAEIPDLTVRIVREKIIYFMTNELGMSYATAEVIGEAIEGALWILM